MIRAILFDLDNTLIDRAAAFERYATALLKRRTSAHENREELLRLMTDADREHQHREFNEYANQMLRMCPDLRWEPEEFLADYLPGLLSEIRPQPEIRGLLSELRFTYAIGIVTNGGSTRQREKLERAKLLEFFEKDRILISEEAGVKKPDPRIFQYALNAVAAKAEETLFCGDDARCDIAGAKQIGMKTCWVWKMLGHSDYPSEYPEPDARARTLVELPALLAGVFA